MLTETDFNGSRDSWESIIDHQVTMSLKERGLAPMDVVGKQLENERFEMALKLLVEFK